MIATPCPYCGHPKMPPPPNVPRPYGKCPNCGRKSRAVIHHHINGARSVKYVATSKPSRHMQVISIRLPEDQIQWLAQFPNRSNIIQMLLDREMSK
ncbi:MAG: hypothetical protein HY867_06160 [Chloroflexi bacterium]|nr:hypothetical protein [Chloroflexota bacterium]